MREIRYDLGVGYTSYMRQMWLWVLWAIRCLNRPDAPIFDASMISKSGLEGVGCLGGWWVFEKPVELAGDVSMLLFFTNRCLWRVGEPVLVAGG